MVDEKQQLQLLGISWLVFLASLLLRQETAINQDLGRHLRLGEAVVTDSPAGARRAALTTNYLTYTHQDYPFVNHHWGSEVIFYLLHRGGGFSLLIGFKTLVLSLTFIITALNAGRIRNYELRIKKFLITDYRLPITRNVIALTMTFLSIQMMATRFVTRPEIFGYLLFSLIFFLLSRIDNKYIDGTRPRLIYILLPLLMLVWVNLHISFIFGLLLIWLWSGSQIFKRGLSLEKSKDNPHQWAIAQIVQKGLSFRVQKDCPYRIIVAPIISTIATLFNPAGLRGALMPVAILRDYGYSVAENMTPFFLRGFRPQPEYLIYAGLVTGALVLFLFSSKRNQFHLLVLVFFSIFPLLAVRHLPFFALVITAVLTPVLIEFLEGLSLRKSKDDLDESMVGLMGAAGLMLLALTNPVPLAFAKLPPAGLTVDQRHFKAVQFIKENNFQGRMWNNYDIGSFLEWALPETPTFVDSRPEAFPMEFFRDVYKPMQESKESWDRHSEKHEVQWVFAALTDATPWFRSWWRMIQAHEDWRLVYWDEATAVLVRQDGINGRIEPAGRVKVEEMLERR